MTKRFKSPRLWSIVLAICTMFWVLDDVSCQVSPHPFTLLGIPVLTLVITINYIFHLFSGKSASEDQMIKSRRGMWRWLVFPVVTLITISALYTPWPMILRFSLSQEAFENKLKEIQSGAKVNMGPQRIGLYWIQEIFFDPDSYIGFRTGESIGDPDGFCYDPAQPPPNPFHRKIVDSWYATEW